MEAQAGHVALDARTVVVLLTVAPAGLQLGSFLLPPKDRYRVEAPVGALFPVEHGTAVRVVVLKRLRTEGIGGTDPLGHPTGDHGVVAVCLGHLGPTDLDALFGVLAEIVAAFALQDKACIRFLSSFKIGFQLKAV